ncbi:glycosyltransferase family 2 protein [Candidatus Gottesmanbacteria bacterium]|nr:glycosyltransferase family 2 protein [Candidatus Gottesmanbacteria bacterium]
MRVSIVVPNYNSGEALLKNLPEVLKTGADEVIVVDDDSTDNSVESIKYYVLSIKYGNKHIKILENKKNLGFSSTVNRGMEEAGGEIVVLLNTDVIPEKNFLDPLISHFSDPKVFAVGCLDKSLENGKIVLRGRGLAKWGRGFLIHWRGEVNKSDTFWVSCGSGAFRKSLWEDLGGLDPLYNPFYWEDIDLSYRAQKAGYKIFFEPKSVVTHRHEEGVIRQKFSPFYIKMIAHRNQFVFAWKHMNKWDLWFSHFFWLPYHFIRALFSFNLAFWLGFLLALVKILRILKKKEHDVTD